MCPLFCARDYWLFNFMGCVIYHKLRNIMSDYMHY